MRTIRPPESKQTTTLQVAVRCRPLTIVDRSKSRDIIRILDEKVVVVSDADGSKDYPDRVQSRNKEKRYAFDYAFGPESRNQDVYNTTVASMIEGVVQGLNATIFAYGATGSGKTYTMAGTAEDPGLMVLSLQDIFHRVSQEEREHEFEVTCSYLEVYNEVIYDLLERSSGHLELREDPDQGIIVAGLKHIKVNSADKILELLHIGNSRRKTEKTDANATSSRSHAVLEIIVKRKQRSHYRRQVLQGKVALVDLAGSERASETNSAGQKLRDGANINRSLLALANCINALGKQQKKGLAYVPYRNSKLTRILKDGLSGNSQTIMVATVASGDDQYYHTINTLKYADRAKEIKTHVQKNVGTIDSHVADYQRMIDNLQVEVSQLRKELAEKEFQLNGLSTGKMQDDELSWLDVLSRDIHENVEDRINLQKALFELEDKNLHNRIELQQLDDLIAKHQIVDEDTKIVEALDERRKVILDNVRDNDEAGAQYRQEIKQNEAQRKDLQHMIDKAISSNGNTTYLRILSQYRLLGMTNTELQFQIAVRDQIINNQREVLSNLWLVLESSGLEKQQILELAARQGITIEDWVVPATVTRNTCSVGIPFTLEQPQMTTCETCLSLELSQVSSVSANAHVCTNCIGFNGCRNKDIQMASSNYVLSDNEGFHLRGERNSQMASNAFHMMNATLLNHGWSDKRGVMDEVGEVQDDTASRMCRFLNQRLLSRGICKRCLVRKKDADVLSEEISRMRVDTNHRRETWPTDVCLQCWCAAARSSVYSTCPNSVNVNEMRGMDCCRNKCSPRHSCGSYEIFQCAESYKLRKIQKFEDSYCGNLCCNSNKVQPGSYFGFDAS